VLLQLRPRLEAVFPGDNEQRVGERERRVEHGLERLSPEPWMVGPDAGGGGKMTLAMPLVELVRLDLELSEVRTRGQRTGRHTRSFRNAPGVRTRAERSGFRGPSNT
jgi:hypothetical protein